LTLAKHKSNLALERVNARLDFESGRIVEARDRYKTLLELYPTKTQLMLDLASVEEKSHNWREALRLYQRAEVLMPHSLAITWAKQNLLHTYGSRVTTSVSYNKIGSNNTQIKAGVQGRRLLENGHVWLVDYFLWDVDNDFAIRRVNGDIESFDGRRHSLSLGVQTAFFAGEQKLSFFAGQKKPGLAWAYQRAENYGLFGAQIDLRVPWFETSEALAGYGSRNRLAINYENTFFNKLYLNSNGSLNYYGLDGIDNAAKSYRVQMDVRYSLVELRDGFLVGYSLDKEKPYLLKTRIDSTGVRFVSLPLDDREQHVFIFGWEKKIDGMYVFESYLGYEYDRLRNTNAPFFRLHLNYQPKPNFEVSANIETGLSTYNEGSDDFLSFGGSISWYF